MVYGVVQILYFLTDFRLVVISIIERGVLISPLLMWNCPCLRSILSGFASYVLGPLLLDMYMFIIIILLLYLLDGLYLLSIYNVLKDERYLIPALEELTNQSREEAGRQL